MAKNFVYSDVSVKGALNQFRLLPKDVQKVLRQQNREDSDMLAAAIRTDAHRANVPPQAALIADSGGVIARTDKTIRVDVGGKKLAKNRHLSQYSYQNNLTGRKRTKKIGTPVGRLVWGATDGSSGKPIDRAGRKNNNRFVLNSNRRGYWLQPTTNRFADALLDKWKRRMQNAFDRAGLK